jgi:dissimilatory sulfite reductase related protein
MELNRDGDGYLVDPDVWSTDVMFAMAEADKYILTEQMIDQIMKARVYYEQYSVVPPIRKFAKFIGEDKKAMFDLWMSGPMKPITKYGGLPKPTGCV